MAVWSCVACGWPVRGWGLCDGTTWFGKFAVSFGDQLTCVRSGTYLCGSCVALVWIFVVCVVFV